MTSILRRKTFLALTCILWVGACATRPPEDAVDVTWDIKSGVDLSAYRTYRWRESANTISRAFEMSGDRGERAERTLRQAVDRQLAEKGYQQVLGDDPDFLVSYHAAVFEVAVPQPTSEERHRAREQEILATADAPIRDIDRDTRPELTRRGTLALYVEDAASGQLAWSGTGAASAVSLKEGRDTVQLIVRLLLERFPD